MADLQVTDTTVPVLIKKLQSCEWLVPNFQREFVWSNAAVISLINSIIDAKPIGMLTLWEQEGNSQIDLEPVSVTDWDKNTKSSTRKFFGNIAYKPGRFFAILDGRQRSTALAIAFGGLRSDSGIYKTSGRYFLDVAAKDDSERVRFISEKEIKKKKLDTDAAAIALGLFPLECRSGPDGMYRQWMRYLQEIKDPKNYPNGDLISDSEIERRNELLTSAFAGIIETKIAVYIVPSEYDLASICEIFETLNTTGTKVSTVDLIHNFLVMDTQVDPEGPLLLRERIDDLGAIDGAVGWANSKDRPEIIAQLATACYAISDSKPDPRSLSGAKATRITSVKSEDLLALPSEFWRKVFQNEQLFAGFLGEFQRCVADGYFGMRNCPYPASAAVYVGLRWHHQFDDRDKIKWSIADLNSLYRAFFWRNALTTRYDQGFLTQIGADLKALKEILEIRPTMDFGAWSKRAGALLSDHMAKDVIREQVVAYVTDGEFSGAVEKAVQLLFVGRASRDFIDPNLTIDFYSGEMQIHHIYPKDWCNNNRTGSLADYLDKDKAGKDWVNSAANLVPMHRQTNNWWKKKIPAQALTERDVEFSSVSAILEPLFVDKTCFKYLVSGRDKVSEFWERRATLIVDELVRRTEVYQS